MRLLVLIVSLIAIVNLSGSIWDAWWRGGVLGERHTVLVEAKRENEELKARLDEAQMPAFIEREARNKLGMTKEGETIVIMPNDKLQMPNDEKRGEVPNWKQWVTLFY